MSSPSAVSLTTISYFLIIQLPSVEQLATTSSPRRERTFADHYPHLPPPDCCHDVTTSLQNQLVETHTIIQLTSVEQLATTSSSRRERTFADHYPHLPPPDCCHDVTISLHKLLEMPCLFPLTMNFCCWKIRFKFFFSSGINVSVRYHIFERRL